MTDVTIKEFVNKGLEGIGEDISSLGERVNANANISNKDIYSSYGVGFHSKDREDTFNDTLFDNIKDCGLSRVRLFPNWARCETVKGQYDFTEFDVGVQQAEKHGLQITCVLGYNNPLYFGGDERGHAIETTEQQTAFLNYTYALAEKYKGHNFRWEFYNEIGMNEFYKPSDGQESTIVNSYMTLIKQGYRKLKEIDPGCEVIGGAIAQVTDKTLRIFEECCKQDLLNFIDGLVFHEYHSSDIVENVLKDHVAKLRLILMKYKRGDMPIHLTEIGYNDCPDPKDTSIGKNLSEEMKGAYLIRTLLAGLVNGIDEVLIYRATATHEDTQKQTYWYGIFSIPDNYAPTKSAQMIKTFMDEMKGYKLISRLKSNTKDFYYLCQKENSYKVIYHTISADHTASIGGESVSITAIPQILDIEIKEGFDINTLQSQLDAIYSKIANSGSLTKATDGTGENSVVLGDISTSTATAKGSVAMGGQCTAGGASSVAAGGGVKTSNWGEVAFGHWNTTESGQAFSIGNGKDNANRSNLISIDTTGNVKNTGRFISKGFNFAIKALFPDGTNAADNANLFVKIVATDSKPRLAVAEALSDVIGVATADTDLESAFIAQGFAFSKADDTTASNVALIGTPFVLTNASDIAVGDKVIPTTGGKAVKSSDGTGYLVLGVASGKVRILLK